MRADFAHIHWGRVLLAGAVAAGLSVALVLLVVTVYVTSLAFQARAQPDQAELAAFAAQVSRWLRPVLALLAATMLFGGALDLLTLAGLILTVAAAWLGGTIGSRNWSQAI